MDKNTGKRAVVGIGVATRGSSLSSRDSSNNENRNAQCCNRLGCSTRFNSMKGSVGKSERDNRSGLSVRSRGGNSNVGSSSKTYSTMNEVKKTNQGFQKQSCQKDAVSAETSNMRMEEEVSDPSTFNARVNPRVKGAEQAGVLNGLSVNTSEEVVTSNESSNIRTQKQTFRRPGLSNQDFSPNSSARRSFAPKNSFQASKAVSNGQGSSSRYGLRNLGCSSISDVLPGCSSSDSGRGRRTEVAKRKSSEGARGKVMIGSSSGGNSVNQNSPSGSNLSISERPSSSHQSSRTRNWAPSRDGVTSVRTRRTINGETRSRLSETGVENNSSQSDPLVVISELSPAELTVGQSSQPSSLHQSSSVHPMAHRSSFDRPGSSNGNVRIRPSIHSEDDGLRMFSGLSVDRDGLRRFNIDGIAEVLLALDRIEHDEELTYEQLLALEANLFLGGISFHDQHRDMRLDIDNMSYEELLALEEKMGNVSTALTEETILKCLRRNCYNPVPADEKNVESGDDDAKCTVCQEEYVEGDEVGKLRCDHRYHVVCVQQWLRQKNWCPICKAPAADS
ncbi:E3 ubiquitin-protein ligase MBR2-like [Papaver somniferum]|uniref:E3 ubiquitin-protein ligase MBR2-like n=1 Tax=Papaver somniferum TaxID=3469 RepID=UPI000E705EC7|nr:E3 ubiquitin-protein ligase MBR2-like [Papaver somniferum]XP_026404071.1 E3 ubiquitin-protein ligase MBR2-like [Papaver somniferum]